MNYKKIIELSIQARSFQDQISKLYQIKGKYGINSYFLIDEEIDNLKKELDVIEMKIKKEVG